MEELTKVMADEGAKDEKAADVLASMSQTLGGDADDIAEAAKKKSLQDSRTPSARPAATAPIATSRRAGRRARAETNVVTERLRAASNARRSLMRTTLAFSLSRSVSLSRSISLSLLLGTTLVACGGSNDHPMNGPDAGCAVNESNGDLGSADPFMSTAAAMLADGRQTFRYDTFGDEAFWGDTLELHKAIAGAANGGVGGGVSPKTALVGRPQGRRRRAARATGRANQGRAGRPRRSGDDARAAQAERGRRRHRHLRQRAAR